MEEQLFDEDVIDDLDFYSEDIIEKLLEYDELTGEEAAFMRGYEEEI